MKSNFIKFFFLTRVNSHERKFLGSRPQFVALCSRSYCNISQDKEGAPPTPAVVEPPVEPLVDSFGRRHDYLRISLTERCNLRCTYCMPAEGVPLSPRGALLTAEELARLARVFAALGVRKARLTGGEPTLRRDLEDVLGALAGAGVTRLALTSNGVALARRLPRLQRAGLTALNLSLDSLRPDRYERLARRPALPRVLATMDLALQLDLRPLKLNVVLIKGFNDDEILDFVELTRDRDLEVRFIEFMPFSGNRWDEDKLVPYRAALGAVRAHYPALEPQPPRPNDTATVWRVPGYAGSVGFIHSMTEHFCASCNRLRLTADGNLKVCLFGNAEVSLRDAVRAGATDTELRGLVRGALARKKERHAARGVRRYCTDGGAFSHLDAEGRARMVDVGGKDVTRREAAAACSLEVSGRLLRLLRDARLPKGDALSVAQVAGALGAKRTPDLVPMCHALPLDSVRVRIMLPRGECATGGAVTLRCDVAATARTGVEMEALTGAAVAALALYDMCKSVDRAMRITDLRLLHKTGGNTDYPPPSSTSPTPPTPPPTPAPRPSTRDRDQETYAPTDLMHF